MKLEAPDFLRSRLAYPVAIFGAGVSGNGVQALAASLGSKSQIYDDRAEEFTVEAARKHGVVVYSPGFRQDHPWLQAARVAQCVCLSELDFASLFWRGRIVAITGTNGKTTLTEFLTYALKSIGAKAWGTGNIGYSFSKLVVDESGASPVDYAICEISSFQAEALRHLNPNATLWTNFAEDHLERHGSMDSYFQAKWALAERTPEGALFLGTSVTSYARAAGMTLPRGCEVQSESQPSDPMLEGTAFEAYPQRENFLLAQSWWKASRLGEVALYAAARSFRLARHRLSKVLEIEGVTYWNDSKATNFHAVEAALGRFTQPVILIAGGKSKGGDIPAFAARIARSVRHVCLIGETRSALAAALGNHCVAFTVCASLEEAVTQASEKAVGGDNVLLGPGFSSFDMFKNYEDRGAQFESLVRRLRSPAQLT